MRGWPFPVAPRSKSAASILPRAVLRPETHARLNLGSWPVAALWCAVLLALAPARAGAHAEHAAAAPEPWSADYTLVELAPGSDLNAARQLVQARGGTVALLLPPCTLTGWIPPSLDATLRGHAGIRSLRARQRPGRGRPGETARRGATDPATRPPAASSPVRSRERSGTRRGRRRRRRPPRRLPIPQPVRPAACAPMPGSAARSPSSRSPATWRAPADRATGEGGRRPASGRHQRLHDRYGGLDDLLRRERRLGHRSRRQRLDGGERARGHRPGGGGPVVVERAGAGPQRLLGRLLRACPPGHRGPEVQPVARAGAPRQRHLHRRHPRRARNFGYSAGDPGAGDAYNAVPKEHLRHDWAYCAFVAANPYGPNEFTNGYSAWAYIGGPYRRASSTVLVALQPGLRPRVRRTCSGPATSTTRRATAAARAAGLCGSTGAPNGNCEYCNPAAVSCMMRSQLLVPVLLHGGATGLDAHAVRAGTTAAAGHQRRAA